MIEGVGRDSARVRFWQERGYGKAQASGPHRATSFGHTANCCTLPWCLFATLAVAAVLVAVDKYYPLGLKSWAWPAIGLATGLVASAAAVWLRGQSELDAAIEIDRRLTSASAYRHVCPQRCQARHADGTGSGP